jgi:nucleoside-diphosphate-sugar epimerase
LSGAQGVIGRNLMQHLATLGDWDVIGLSRRGGEPADRVRHIAVDLLDRTDCSEKVGGLTQVTHSSTLLTRTGPPGPSW